MTSEDWPDEVGRFSRYADSCVNLSASWEEPTLGNRVRARPNSVKGKYDSIKSVEE